MQRLAFIVNAYENPMEVRCCLASLSLQWPSEAYQLHVAVADNSKTDLVKQVCDEFSIAVWHKTEGHCYTASEQVAKLLSCEWLCFASSDGYYVPGFSSIMLETAARLSSDLVYCNCLYDPRLHGRGIYSVLDSFPEIRWIDKTNFIVRAELFKGWPDHPSMYCDGLFVENLVKAGKKVDKAKGILVVHN